MCCGTWQRPHRAGCIAPLNGSVTSAGPFLWGLFPTPVACAPAASKRLNRLTSPYNSGRCRPDAALPRESAAPRTVGRISIYPSRIPITQGSRCRHRHLGGVVCGPSFVASTGCDLDLIASLQRDVTGALLSDFQSLGLAPKLISALETAGLTQPTPIQAKAIPLALQGTDVMASPRPAPAKPWPLACR